MKLTEIILTPSKSEMEIYNGKSYEELQEAVSKAIEEKDGKDYIFMIQYGGRTHYKIQYPNKIFAKKILPQLKF